METLPEIYPLTSLQIGDILSYLSQAFLYFAPSSKRLLILVDNRPWSLNRHSRSTQLWQLMVIKYRMSPFINTRTLAKDSSDHGRNDCLSSNLDKFRKFGRWFSVIDAAKYQKKSLLSVMDLSKALHGFIVFDVSWKDVRGINYFNELQTDTSLALEVEFMRKWEFHSPNEAVNSLSSWFSGTWPEKQSLGHNLRKLSDLNIHHCISLTSSKEVLFRSSFLLETFPEDMFYDAEETVSETDTRASSMESFSKEDKDQNDKQYIDHKSDSIKCAEMDESSAIPTIYMDNLLLLRFSDSILPFKLRQIVMSDLRLLRLLESGLPSWVIFLQSYPLFCHFYRPWIRPLVRTLYVLISLSTFIIAFYDLYKNVPLLKATVASLSGPFFDWIEKWDMVSRIQYLGTMLFLQNFEKSVKWFMAVVRTVRPVFEVITKPLVESFSNFAEFISPAWNACAETGELVFSNIWLVFEYFYDAFLDLVEILFWPFEFMYSCVLDTVTSVCPMLSSIWELFLLPIRCVLKLATYVASMLSDVYDLLKNVLESTSVIILNLSEATNGANEMSIWRELWNDIFKQVFRASRSIINGFLAFFTTCNRHRLSIYNHVCAFLWRLAQVITFTPHRCHYDRIPHDHQKENQRECDCCK